MAMFLSEGVQQRVAAIPLDEALAGLHESTMDYAMLTEAILKADFIIHERAASLSEAVALQESDNFIVRAYQKIKEWLIKAWNWIKKVAKAIWAKITEWFNRIKDRVTGNTLVVSDASLAASQAALAAMEKLEKTIGKAGGAAAPAALDSLKVEVEAISKKFESDLADATKQTGTTTVSMTYFNKVVGTAKAATAALEKGEAAANKDVAALEALSKVAATAKDKAGHEGAADKVRANVSEKLEMARQRTAVFSMIAGKCATYASKAAALSAAHAEAMKKAND